MREEYRPETARDRSAKVKRELDAAARSKSVKQTLDKAKKEKPMHEQFSPMGDVITLVANQQPGEATSIVNDLLGARIADALQSRKQDIAKSLFAPSADALAEETKKKSAKSNPAFSALANMSQNIKHDINKVKKLKEEIVQEEFESVEDFKKRGGTVKQIPAHKSYSAPKSQKIKVPFRMGKSAMREEAEQLDELSKETLVNYIPKAAHSLANSSRSSQSGYAHAEMTRSKTAKPILTKMWKKDLRKAINREDGITRAVEKLREEAEQLDEQPTRKHFQQVADVIKAHPDAAKRKELAAHHAGIFKAQNPRFDHHRFYAAANAGDAGV